MNSNYIWINGQSIAYDQAALHVSDLTIQRGYGIFDYFKIVDNQPLFLNDHLDRFYHSAKELYIPVKYSRNAVIEIIHTVIDQNNLPSSGMRLELTGGYSADAYSPAEPNFIIIQQALNPNNIFYQQGIHVRSCLYQRQLPHVKTIDYLMAIRTFSSPEYNDADDILYHNQNSITECPRANFFIVTKDQVLKTVQEDILSGITRKRIVDIARTVMPVEIGPIPLLEVYEAEEAFICSTTKVIVPVSTLDGKIIGNGQGRVVARRLFELLQEQTNQHTAGANR